MTEAIGIRLDEKTLHDVDLLSDEDASDRSTVIRKLLAIGMKELRKERAAQDYREGHTTLSSAAKKAGLTLWDFQHYLVQKGYVSSYSTEDLRQELEN